MKALFPLALICLLVLQSCKDPGCELEAKATDAVTNVLVGALQCASPENVHRDVLALVGKVGLCQHDPKTVGPIAMLVCPVLANFIINKLPKLPKDWNCSAANAKEIAKLMLTTGCNQIPF